MRTYYISKTTIFSGILLIAGLLLCAAGVRAFRNCAHVRELGGLDETDCREGVYVSGTIDSYLVVKSDTLGNARYSGQSETYLTFSDEYDVYTVPVSGDHFIRVMVKEKDTLDALENFRQGKGSAVSFEGILVPADALNEAWYARIEGFDTDAVIGAFAVRQTDLSARKKCLYPGMALLFAAIYFLAEERKNEAKNPPVPD